MKSLFSPTTKNRLLKTANKGFTLMELLIVIAIMGILSTIVVVAVNPGRQLAKARDAQRKTDLISIMAGILEYAQEHSGELPDTDGDPDTNNFPTAATCIGIDVGCFDLAGAGGDGEEIVPVYMVTMPYDPSTGEAGNTGYSIYVDANGRLHAAAVGEITNPITVDR